MSSIYKKQETDSSADIDCIGSVGNIFRANWKDSDTVLVLKSSYKLTVQEIVNELKIQPIQLANAISCIHNEDIVHGDLNSYNILVHQNNIKLTNFGLSRKITEDSHYDEIFTNKLGIEYDIDLVKEIKKGKREEIVEDTPVKYSNLYTACWVDDPDKRPNIYDIVLSLKELETE
ncbi:unnamed protein product [Rhizophagus irregularis]|nr:unnamed protein product [Rhizophagus irregularis]